jgi:hypothetical protein
MSTNTFLQARAMSGLKRAHPREVRDLTKTERIVMESGSTAGRSDFVSSNIAGPDPVMYFSP